MRAKKFVSQGTQMLFKEGTAITNKLVQHGTQLIEEGTAAITQQFVVNEGVLSLNIAGVNDGTVDKASQCYVGEISTEIHVSPDELGEELFAFSEPFARGGLGIAGDSFLGTL